MSETSSYRGNRWDRLVNDLVSMVGLWAFCQEHTEAHPLQLYEKQISAQFHYVKRIQGNIYPGVAELAWHRRLSFKIMGYPSVFQSISVREHSIVVSVGWT